MRGHAAPERPSESVGRHDMTGSPSERSSLTVNGSPSADPPEQRRNGIRASSVSKREKYQGSPIRLNRFDQEIRKSRQNPQNRSSDGRSMESVRMAVKNAFAGPRSLHSSRASRASRTTVQPRGGRLLGHNRGLGNGFGRLQFRARHRSSTRAAAGGGVPKWQGERGCPSVGQGCHIKRRSRTPPFVPPLPQAAARTVFRGLNATR
jgi:hypothetical protein